MSSFKKPAHIPPVYFKSLESAENFRRILKEGGKYKDIKLLRDFDGSWFVECYEEAKKEAPKDYEKKPYIPTAKSPTRTPKDIIMSRVQKRDTTQDWATGGDSRDEAGRV